CSLAVLRDEHGKYVHFSGHPTMPPIFFDLDADPAQIVNRAADPEYAPTVLDYAQRMLARRMTHAERTLTGMKLTQHVGLVVRREPRCQPSERERVAEHAGSGKSAGQHADEI